MTLRSQSFFWYYGILRFQWHSCVKNVNFGFEHLCKIYTIFKIRNDDTILSPRNGLKYVQYCTHKKSRDQVSLKICENTLLENLTDDAIA